MTVRDAVEAVAAVYRPHYPKVRVHLRNGITVRSGDGQARILIALPRPFGGDETKIRADLVRQAIEYLPKRLERDAAMDMQRQADKERERARQAAYDRERAYAALLTISAEDLAKVADPEQWEKHAPGAASCDERKWNAERRQILAVLAARYLVSMRLLLASPTP